MEFHGPAMDSTGTRPFNHSFLENADVLHRSNACARRCPRVIVTTPQNADIMTFPTPATGRKSS